MLRQTLNMDMNMHDYSSRYCGSLHASEYNQILDTLLSSSYQ